MVQLISVVCCVVVPRWEVALLLQWGKGRGGQVMEDAGCCIPAHFVSLGPLDRGPEDTITTIVHVLNLPNRRWGGEHGPHGLRGSGCDL